MPLYKDGIQSSPSNYRPSSMTSFCSKTLERFIVPRLYEYLCVNNLLSAFQFGFCAGLSVSDQLLLVYQYVSVHMDRGNNADVLQFYYCKVLDVVNQKLSLSKFTKLAFLNDNPLLDWIKDFLTACEIQWMSLVVYLKAMLLVL